MIMASPPSSSCLGTAQSFHGELKAEHRTRLRQPHADLQCVFVFMPLKMSTHDALGQLPAIGYFSFPSLSRTVAFPKASNIPKWEWICFISAPSFRIRSFELSDVTLCCFCCVLFPWNMKLWKLASFCLKKRMCVAVVHCRHWRIQAPESDYDAYKLGPKTDVFMPQSFYKMAALIEICKTYCSAVGTRIIFIFLNFFSLSHLWSAALEEKNH